MSITSHSEFTQYQGYHLASESLVKVPLKSLSLEQIGPAEIASMISLINFLQGRQIKSDQDYSDLLAQYDDLSDDYKIACQERDDAYTRISRYEEEKTRNLYHQKHLASVFRNPDLSGNEKLAGVAMLEEIAILKDDPHEPTLLCMQTIADRVGYSTSTLNRVNKKMSALGAWKYDQGETTVVDGKYHTPITITMDKFVDAPSQITKDKDKKHGGVREKRCKGCGSDNLDLHTMQYCRSCKKVHIEAQAGIRSDANVYDALSAIAAGDVEVSEFLEIYATNAQKQDAFELLNEIDDQDNTKLPVDQVPQKQDAFQIDQVATSEIEKHLAFEPAECNMRDNNTSTDIPRKLVPVESKSTKPTVECYFCHISQWSYSHHEQLWMCAECYSPVSATMHNLKVEKKW